MMSQNHHEEVKIGYLISDSFIKQGLVSMFVENKFNKAQQRISGPHTRGHNIRRGYHEKQLRFSFLFQSTFRWVCCLHLPKVSSLTSFYLQNYVLAKRVWILAHRKALNVKKVIARFDWMADWQLFNHASVVLYSFYFQDKSGEALWTCSAQ